MRRTPLTEPAEDLAGRRRTHPTCQPLGRPGVACPRVLRRGVQRGAGEVEPDAAPRPSCMTVVLASSRVSRRSVWALPSNPPIWRATSSSAASPLCPNGGCPRSWARQAVSTTSGSQPSACPSSRPTWATSRVWVRRVRTKSSVPGPMTWVLAASRRSAAECRTRARSRANGVRLALFGGSGDPALDVGCAVPGVPVRVGRLRALHRRRP